MDFTPYQEPPANVRPVEDAPWEVTESALGGTRSATSWRANSASLRRAPESIVRSLGRVFIFRGYREVERMAEATPHLVSLLVEARQQVARIFGPDVPLVLEVVSNPEAADALPELFLYIQTRLPVLDARQKLERLDDEWWLDTLPRAEGRLTVALEYV